MSYKNKEKPLAIIDKKMRTCRLMEFAIVDIETTGGMPHTHGITEIAIVMHNGVEVTGKYVTCLLYTSPSPRDRQKSRMPSSA